MDTPTNPDDDAPPVVAPPPTLADYVDVLSGISRYPVTSARLRAARAINADGDVTDPEAAVLIAGECAPLLERGGTTVTTPDGPAVWLRDATTTFPDLVVTGGFAAAAIAPITVPTLAVVYLPDGLAAAEVCAATGARPAPFGDALILPADPGATRQSYTRDGVRWAWPWRVAADTATGPGRDPAAAAAVAQTITALP